MCLPFDREQSYLACVIVTFHDLNPCKLYPGHNRADTAAKSALSLSVTTTILPAFILLPCVFKMCSEVAVTSFMAKSTHVWYGIVEFNVPLDTVQVISETGSTHVTAAV